MLDIKSNLVLKILKKECHGQEYKIIEKTDIIYALPVKYRVSEEALDHIITYLERSECIHVKYDDENVYCLCILPYGEQINENDKADKKKKNKNITIIILTFISALLGGIIGSIISHLIKF